MVGAEFVDIGGDALEFQRIDGFELRRDLAEAAEIGEQVDALERGHRVMVAPFGADLEVFLLAAGEDQLVAVLALFPEALRDVLALGHFALLLDAAVGDPGRMNDGRDGQGLGFFGECCHDDALCKVLVRSRKRQRRATEAAKTFDAPASSRTEAAADKVAPVVRTSSTTNIARFWQFVERVVEKAPVKFEILSFLDRRA